MIYHITTTAGLELFEEQSHYKAESLDTEGFTHCCSSYEQLLGVVKRYYAATSNLLVLHINEKTLDCELKYELAPNSNEVYPHVFGPIVKTAIVNVTTLKIEGRD